MSARSSTLSVRPRFAPLAIERLEDRRLLSYMFTKIADTGDGLSNFGDAPALNNNGTVAFLAHPANEHVRQCILTSAGADPVRIACEGPLDVSLSTQPSIADDGTVAFVLSFRQTMQQIMTGDGSTVTTLYATQPATFFTDFGSPALNQAGTVAFWAATLILSSPEGVFRGDGGPPAFIDRGDSFDFTHFGRLPSLNDAGTVAYRYEFRGPVFRTSINVGDGKTTTVLYSNQDGVFQSFGNPVLNDAGVAAFYAGLADGGSGIFSGDGGPVTVHARTDDVFQSFADAPALNNAGRVAFLATLVGGYTAIFTHVGTVTNPVIAVGDDLQGSQVAELHFFRQGLNDAGQVAFMARLADGTSGVYRADPQPPGARGRGGEPGVVSLLVSRPAAADPRSWDGLSPRWQPDSRGSAPTRLEETPRREHLALLTAGQPAYRLPAATLDRLLAEVAEPGFEGIGAT